MKNKVCYILLSLLLSFSFINNVFADGITITAVPDSTKVVKGEKVSVVVKLTADEPIAHCKFQLSSDESIVLDNVASYAEGWTSTYGAYGYMVENSDLYDTDAPDNLGILQINYIVNGDGNVTLKTEQCVTLLEDKPYTYGDITLNLTAIDLADDTTLSSLTVTNAEAFNFDPDKTSFPVKLTSPTFGLNMTTKNPDYQDDIVVKDADGNVIEDYNNITYNPPSGNSSMLITITVNGQTTYTLGVSYVQEELDNSLSSLKINGKEYLADCNGECTIEVESDVTSVLIEAIIKDSEHFQFGEDTNILSGVFDLSDTDTVDAYIVVEPKNSQLGAVSKDYSIRIKKKGSSGSSGDSDKDDKPSGSVTKPSGSGNVDDNPGTSDISMFLMAFILIASLVGSIVLYQKNLESYK